jgi:LemA protein
MIYLLIVIVVLVLVGIGLFNSLVRSRNRVDEAWSDIDVQLKRRYDLIPNLVETVKGYAAHERGTLDEVVEARSKASSITVDPSKASAQDLQKMQSAQGELSNALGRLFALAESYPDLKANQNFLKLQGDLTDTEDKIQAARRFYNGTVRDFNTKLQVFPTNIFASMMGFVKREFFGVDDAAQRQAPQVKF